ncbi:hypothetical protein KDL01_28280, partial [Actinospica durhamensis]
PPAVHRPRDPHPQPRMEIRASTDEEIRQGEEQRHAEIEEYRREHFPTAYERNQDEMAYLGHAVDPSGMGIVKAPVTLIYMAAGDDLKTASQKAANVDHAVGLLTLAAEGKANSVTDTKWGSDVPDQADPHGSLTYRFDERGAYLQQRADNRAAGRPKVESTRSFDVKATLDRTRPVTDPHTQAAVQAGIAEYNRTGSSSLAGSVVHEESGFAGSQQGVDDITGPTLLELKTAWGTSVDLSLFNLKMRGADRQTLEAQVLLQQAAQRAGRPQLVKIRIQRHLFIDPRTSQAVQVSK